MPLLANKALLLPDSAGSGTTPPAKEFKLASNTTMVFGRVALVRLSRGASFQVDDSGQVEVGEPSLDRLAEFARIQAINRKTGVGASFLLEGVRVTPMTRMEFSILSRCAFVSSQMYMVEAAAKTPLQLVYYQLQQAYAGPEIQRSVSLRQFQNLVGYLPAHIQAAALREGRDGLFATLRYLHKEIAKSQTLRIDP